MVFSRISELLRPFLVALYQLDAVALLQLAGEAGTDIAATDDHDATVGALEALQLGHHGADVTGGGDEEHLVIRFDDGGALGADGAALAEDGGHPGLDVWHVIRRVERALPTSGPP